MTNNNANLNKAGKAKKDEFYTQLVDIENELKHYKSFFKGKTVFCNCDDPYESNFVKYFAMNFNELGLKKLIATCYATSSIMHSQMNFFGSEEVMGVSYPQKKPYKIELTEIIDENGDGAIGLDDFERTLRKRPPVFLKGEGDFRSSECVELLKQADVVVTNPPFSLFREFIELLEKHGKKYIVIGNVNAITYKEVFPLIMQNRLWLGASIHSGDREFRVPDSYPLEAAGCRTDKSGIKYIRVKGVRWFTNVDYPARHDELVLYRHYTLDEYPTYDNYDAIEVSKTSEIPCDYDGVMGVPITFMDKYNPDQFEIVGMCENLDLYHLKTRVYTPKECRDRYFELFGKQGTYDLNAAGVVNGIKVYQRILIRRKQNGNPT